jgi:hypothetical protein
VGVRDDSLRVSAVSIDKFVVSCMVQDLKHNFSWKLLVVYGPSYDDKKVEFVDELLFV